VNLMPLLLKSRSCLASNEYSSLKWKKIDHVDRRLKCISGSPRAHFKSHNLYLMPTYSHCVSDIGNYALRSTLQASELLYYKDNFHETCSIGFLIHCRMQYNIAKRQSCVNIITDMEN